MAGTTRSTDQGEPREGTRSRFVSRNRMRLLCDENAKGSIYSLLKQEGYEVTRVQDDLAIGDDDREIIEHCRAEQLVLFTNDDDFSRSIRIPELSFSTNRPLPHVTSSPRLGGSRGSSVPRCWRIRCFMSRTAGCEEFNSDEPTILLPTLSRYFRRKRYRAEPPLTGSCLPAQWLLRADDYGSFTTSTVFR